MSVKIYAMNGYDFIAAESMEQAEQCLAATCANGVVDKDFKEEFLINPRVLIEEEIKYYKIFDEHTKQPIATFKEWLGKLIVEGKEFPCYFYCNI